MAELALVVWFLWMCAMTWALLWLKRQVRLLKMERKL